MRRALVSLPEGVWQIIDTELKGKLGNGDSEVLRNIIIGFLTDKGYMDSPKKAAGIPRDVKEEVTMHDKMLSALVEVLEEKGSITYEEWENRIRKKIAESSSSNSSSKS